MPVPPGLSDSPFQINRPQDRWRPNYKDEEENFKNLAPFVQKIREEIYDWRQFGYDGISSTSKSLLNFWFKEEHKNGFQYYFGQRESVESVIYIFEKIRVRDSKELIQFDSWGITEKFLNDYWLRLVIKQATGSGKTKVLTLLMAWSYFHKEYENKSDLSKNFLLIAPNTIVLDRLRNDIEGLKVFANDPIIPTKGYLNKDWYFSPKVHIQDEINTISNYGNIFLTNIQRFANRTTKNSNELKNKFLNITLNNSTEEKIGVKNIVKDLDDLIVLNDEAHHIHEDNAWKRSIEEIDNNFIQKGKKLPLQIDVTATPKNKKGQIFHQTISDYPLVEAIHQKVVKKPVIPDLPSRQQLKEYSSSVFSERYKEYLNLGVTTWKKQYEKHKKLGKKALLFVMVDDTKNCDDVAEYLRSTFSDLKGDGTFVIHTKGNPKDHTGEINENSSKGKEELSKLRRLVNTVDNFDSPIKAIVSVLMLKEGWDVKNVTTIVGLRAYASHILPEQTLGRGLRRMYFQEDLDEELDVIGTDNFIEYVKGISKEGIQLEERPVGVNHPESGPLVIEIDHENAFKNIESLDFAIPQIPNRFARDFLALYLLDPNKFNFKSLKLKTYSDEEKTKRITFRDTINEEEVKVIHFDNLSNLTSQSVIGFFTQTITRELRLNNLGINHFIYEKLKKFITSILFGKEVDIEDKNILRNLSEPFVTEVIKKTFFKEINQLMIKDFGFKEINKNAPISKTKPYLCSRKRQIYTPKKSVFNIISGDSKFEIEFAQYLDNFSDVISFFKNDIQLKISIEYVKHDGTLGNYHPDFYLQLNNNEFWIVETKGAESLNDKRKFERLKTWCIDASSVENKWNCLLLRQEIWNSFKVKPNTFIELKDMVEIH